MKISLALGPRGPLSRQTAWGCFTTNLSMPGFGSLVAGRVSGYPQAACTMIGFVISVFGAGRAFTWFTANLSRMQEQQGDMFANLAQTWMAVRWAVLGMAIFGFGWLWAL